MHPLLGDLTQLSDDELLKRTNELFEKLRKSYYIANPQVAMQLRMILDGYLTENQRRQQLNQEKFMQQNKKYTDGIDIS